MNASPHAMTPEEYELFNEFLGEHFGLTFPDHKREILESRLRPRLGALRLQKFMDYYMLLQYSGNGELRHLAQTITNNETYFFRETHQFDALLAHALDSLKAESAAPGSMRVLCAGCSSGEEPYTLNIFLKESQYRLWGCATEIDAFDLDEVRVAAAQRAEYAGASLRSASEEQLRRYFTAGPAAGLHALKPAFRTGVTFRAGNIVAFESYGRMSYYDVLFCRNVLIYFSEATLRKAVENFARCLRRGGLLFLGHSESIIGLSERFEPVRLGDCIAYRRV